jgi:transmembrane sensor
MSNQILPGELESSDRGEAQAWVVRLASGRMTVEDGTEFRGWLAANPAHARAFAEAKQHWDLIGTAVQELAHEGQFAAQHNVKPGQRRAPTISRRWLLGAGAAAAAAGVVLAIRPPLELWSPLVDFGDDYHTGIGQTKTIAVSENVTVELSTRSRLALQADRPDGLRVALLAGEAAVQSVTRRITVVAGNGETQAVSGRFNLRNDLDIVRVTCLDGAIEVSCNGRKVALSANQQVVYNADGLSSIAAADAEEVSAWQHGILLFRAKSLSYVVDEINRYRPGRIILINRSLGARPVAVASFHLDHLDDAIPQMEAMYGAIAHYLPGGIVLLG